MSALARLKRGVRAAIELCGGIEGSAATVGKSKTLAGNWNNRNDTSTPSIGDAHALDEVAVIKGEVPAILTAYAAELGHVAIRLPEVQPGVGDIHAMLADHCKQSGEFSQAMVKAIADRTVSAAEASAALDIALPHIAVLAEMVEGLRLIADGDAG